MKNLVIAKFGGTSVGNAKQIKKVTNILKNYQNNGRRVISVVSAMSSVTDLLLVCLEAALAKKEKQLKRTLNTLQKRHYKTLEDLNLTTPATKQIKKIFTHKFATLTEVLDSIAILGEASARAKDYLLSFGERLSIHLLAGALNNSGLAAEAVNTRHLIKTNDNFGNAEPDLKSSAAALKKKLLPMLEKKILPVLTGFIGSAPDGSYTTLGRGGSDFTATIVGNIFDAEQVDIWTDVDGVMTADPKIVKDAKLLKQLTYNEAAELSYFGAKVLHPKTIIPVQEKNIPLFIKNSFHPEGSGTKISAEKNNSRTVKAITAISDLSLITLQGKGMIGMPGMAAKLFSAVAAVGGNVMFISQASSEHNITFAVKREQEQRIVDALKKEFELQLLKKDIEGIYTEKDVAIIAVVGEGMKHTPGIAGKTFTALGKKQVNIIAIAQGSSELNISLAIKKVDINKAVKAIHDAFNLGKAMF